MERKKLFLILQSVVCVLGALALIAAVLVVYFTGSEAHALDPLTPVFSQHIVGESLKLAAPLLFIGLCMTAVGLLLGVQDEKGLGPVKGGKVENRAPGGKTLRTVLLIAAAVLLIVGILNGSARDVFVKAAKICTECVGLG